MKGPCLKKLRAMGSRLALREAVVEVCRPFAEITNLDLVAAGDSSYFCLVGVSKPEQALALMREVGGLSFGGGVCFRIPRTWNAQA